MKRILIYSGRFNASYNQLTLSLMREGRRRGWRFVWLNPSDAPDESARVAKILEIVKPSGIIGNDTTAIAHLLPRGFPTVWVDSRRKSSEVPVVRHDNASFGVAAADALLGQGTEFAVFGLADRRCYWSVVREKAFAERIRAAGSTCRRAHFDMWLDNPYYALEDIRRKLAELKRPVSIFAVSDWVADVVLMAAESLGWRCPQDFRLVGVDDDELVCMRSPVALSSIRPDWEMGGRLAFEALDVQMRGEKPRREYLYGAVGVVRRASTRTPYARPVDSRVENALAFIAAEYASPISVGDVVEAMGCSRRLAELRFRQETGRTIAGALEDRRHDRLLVELKRRNIDIQALPEMCGFRTAAALRECFRRRTGMSITAWRRANATGDAASQGHPIA